MFPRASRKLVTRTIFQYHRRWMSVRPQEIGQNVNLKENSTCEYLTFAAVFKLNLGRILVSSEKGHHPIVATAGGCTNTYNYVDSIRFSNRSRM